MGNITVRYEVPFDKALSTVLHVHPGTDLNLPFLEVRSLYIVGTTRFLPTSVKRLKHYVL